MQKKDRRPFNLPRTLKLVALLFLMLGTANVWYGDRRSDRYEVLLSEAETKLSDPDSNKEQQLRYVKRLRSRIVFYSTVENGGRVLLAISMLLIVASVFVSKQPEKQKHEVPNASF